MTRQRKKKKEPKENWRGYTAPGTNPDGSPRSGFPRPGIHRFRVFPIHKLYASPGSKDLVDVAIIELLPRAKPRKRP